MQTETDAEIESALIGCFLLDHESAANEASDFSLAPEMFVSPKARLAFATMALFLKG